MMLVYVLQTALPLILILWLAVLPPKSRAGFWMLVLASTLTTFAAARMGIWVFPPWWVPYFLALLLVAAVVWRLNSAPQRLLLPSGAFGWLALVILAGIAGAAGLQSGAAMMASRTPEGPSIDLAWPLGPGFYLVVNGGASASINAHAALLDPAQPLHAGFGGSGYGVDLIAVNDWGLRASGIMPENPPVTSSSARRSLRPALAGSFWPKGVALTCPSRRWMKAIRQATTCYCAAVTTTFSWRISGKDLCGRRQEMTLPSASRSPRSAIPVKAASHICISTHRCRARPMPRSAACRFPCVWRPNFWCGAIWCRREHEASDSARRSDGTG